MVFPTGTNAMWYILLTHTKMQHSRNAYLMWLHHYRYSTCKVIQIWKVLPKTICWENTLSACKEDLYMVERYLCQDNLVVRQNKKKLEEVLSNKSTTFQTHAHNLFNFNFKLLLLLHRLSAIPPPIPNKRI